MKKTKLAVAFLTLIILGLPTSFVSAQTGTTGISVGDTFRFTYAFDVTVDSANF